MAAAAGFVALLAAEDEDSERLYLEDSELLHLEDREELEAAHRPHEARRLPSPPGGAGKPLLRAVGAAAALASLAALLALAAVLWLSSPAAPAAPAAATVAAAAATAASSALQGKDELRGGGLDECGNSRLLNDFTSKRTMEQAGWWFNWTDDFTFKPLIYKDFAPPDSYWGFMLHGSGAISLRVRGEGRMTLDFGNLLGTPGSKVFVQLNMARVAEAGPSVISKTVEIPFHDADALLLASEHTGIIVLNRISFSCSSRPRSAQGKPDKIADASRRWKEAHAGVKEAADLAEKKQEEHSAEVKLEEDEEAVLKELKRTAEAAEHSLSHQEQEDLGENKRLAQAIQAKKDRLERNETWVEQLMANAREQEKRTEKEVEEAEHREDIEASESVKAAKQIAEALVPKSEHRDRATPRPEEHISLYCFALMLPFGYEPNLLAAQKQKRVGTFGCDEWTIFSNSTTLLDTGESAPLQVELVQVSLAVPYGGKWHTALNTPVFNKVWTKVRDMGRYLQHDWVVKADPDTVWFPDRVISVLRQGVPGFNLQTQQRRLLDSSKSPSCSHCKLPGRQRDTHDTCEAHVKWLQAKGKTCDEALEMISRPFPADCDCKCNRYEVCDLSNETDWSLDEHFIRGTSSYSSSKTMPAIYINNCRFGLHGPIEVLSASAVTALVGGLSDCDFLLKQPWGEDKFLDRCMLSLGITRVNVFGLLNEQSCGEEPAPCGGPQAAFHPFKKFDEYFACWAFATSFGGGQSGHHDQRLI